MQHPKQKRRLTDFEVACQWVEMIPKQDREMSSQDKVFVCIMTAIDEGISLDVLEKHDLFKAYIHNHWNKIASYVEHSKAKRIRREYETLLEASKSWDK